MRVNVYAEEMTDRVEIVEKAGFTGVRFYLYLPVTIPSVGEGNDQVRGPFNHHPGDDDSAAVTFWGKKDLRAALQKAIDLLDAHHARPKDNHSIGFDENGNIVTAADIPRISRFMSPTKVSSD